jgi:hypothetical protein
VPLALAHPRKTYLCVSIDCECDKGPGWRTQKPLAFEGVTEGIARRLQPLFRSYGAKPTYLLSPEVIRDAKSADALSRLGTEAELGTHLHGELAEPGAFVPDETTVFQRDYPSDVEEKKLAYLTGLFRDTFGRSPSSFRAGRFGIGPSSIGILESLGYAVESSVTPFMDWSDKAPGLSFALSPTQPYHPDAGEPSRVGSSEILEVPVTIRPRTMQRLPVVGKHVDPRWLRPTRTTGPAMIALAREEAAAAPAGKPVVLNAMFHNVEIVAGASPYAATDREARKILERLGALLAFARSAGIPVIGLSDVPGIYA